MGARVLENSTKRSGKTTVRAQNGFPIVEEVYDFFVVADAVDEPFESVRTATGLPRVGTVWKDFLTVSSIDAQRRDNAAKYWDVSVTLSTNIEDGSQSGGYDPKSDPTTWTPVRETKLERIEDAIIKDKDNRVLKNSAGQGFESALAVGRYIPVWEFYQFEPASVTDETIADRCESINKVAFKGKAKHTLLLNVESSTIGFYFGRRIRLTTYTCKYNKENWNVKRVDGGTYYLDSSGNRKPFKDDDDEFLHYGLLTAGNAVLEGGQVGAGTFVTHKGNKLPVGYEAEYVEYRIYDELDFSTFLRI